MTREDRKRGVKVWCRLEGLGSHEVFSWVPFNSNYLRAFATLHVAKEEGLCAHHIGTAFT
jgi:hypothetical protein